MADEPAPEPTPEAAPAEEKPPAEEPVAPTPKEEEAEETPEERGGAEMKKSTAKENKCVSCLHFLYNPVDKTILGRTGLSWLKILFFYIIFYLAVFAFFMMCLVVFYQTVGSDQPLLTGTDSLLKGHPGLGFRPWPDKDKHPDSSLIWFQQGNSETYLPYVRQLTKIVHKENNNKYLTSTKAKGLETVSCNLKYKLSDIKKLPGTNKTCKPYDDEFLDWGDCSPSKDFGYPVGKPCVLIRINRIIGWEPETNPVAAKNNYDESLKKLQYDPNTLSPKVMPEMEDAAKFIWLDCFGERLIDRRMMGGLKYYPVVKDDMTDKAVRPAMTIPSLFYPYKNQEGYLTPFVMIQFQNPTPGILIQVRCQAYDKNINIDPKDGLGSVDFELLVDHPAAKTS